MYSIKQVSDKLEIPAVTLRAWEKRYQVISPQRSENGYRYYTEQDLSHLQWIKVQIHEKGMTAGQAFRILKERKAIIQQLLTPPGSTTPDTLPTEPVSEQLKHKLYSALLQFQTEQAQELMNLGFSMVGYEQMIQRILVPLLIQVGDEWECQQATVAQEHYITHMIMQRLQQFMYVFPTHEIKGKIIALCPAGEHHEVGLLLFVLFLREQGVDVIYLGNDTPYEGLEQIIDEQQIDGVCISITDKSLMPTALQYVDRLQLKYERLSFALGGQGFYSVPEEYRAWHVTDSEDQWRLWIHHYFAKRQ